MPNIKDESTVEAVARAFTSNGRVKMNALMEVGYNERYSRTCGLKIYDNIRVKAAIARIDAKQAEKADYSIEKYRQELDEARTHAQKLRQPSAEVSAIVAKGRSCGYDKDNDVGSKEALSSVTTEQAALYKEMAQIAIQEKLKGPTLSKETA